MIMGDVLREWTAAVKADLGIDLEVDRALLLPSRATPLTESPGPPPR